MDIREYRYYRTRYGFTGSVDYKFSQNSSIWVRGLYSHFDNFGDRSALTPTINTFTTSPDQGGTRRQYDLQRTNPPSGGGDWEFGGWWAQRFSHGLADLGSVRFALLLGGPRLLDRELCASRSKLPT